MRYPTSNPKGNGQAAPRHSSSLQTPRTRERLRQGVSPRIWRYDKQPPVPLPRPLDVEGDLHQPGSADLAALIPGLTRIGRTVAFSAKAMTAAYGLLQLLALLTHLEP
ncbi:M55 family metallopeptidase [Nonomuraea jabiensis]|uniref:M55 family metallopeptidase n=1 Tax=Nonomuraea jabiensis TaxID=882448 RepID=UPI003429F8EB